MQVPGTRDPVPGAKYRDSCTEYRVQEILYHNHLYDARYQVQYERFKQSINEHNIFRYIFSH